jgi:hypothetical protein
MILQSSSIPTAASADASADTSAALPAPVVFGHGPDCEPLGIQAQRLFASLPYAYRLSITRQRFPHVLDRIAAEWEAPRRLLQLMDELLIDQRGNRQGFPFESVLELTNLREYYLNEVHVGLRTQIETRRTPW